MRTRQVTYPDWPATRWRLTAPESYVVLSGPSASGAEAFKLSVMELVARGALVLDDAAEQRRLIQRRRVSAVRDGPRAMPPAERALAATWDVYQQAPRRVRSNGEPAVAVSDLARAAARTFGSLDRYLARAVVPALQERGLSEARTRRILGIFPITRQVLTAEGEAARAELQQWLDVGRERFPSWMVGDPTQALAYAGAAGAALLLMPAVFPELRRLRERLPAQGTIDDDTPDMSSSTYLLSDGYADGGLDFFGIDFGNLDLNVFDGFEAAMSAIDAAVDSSGVGDSGGGGGDSSGGGGDSGGGGGDSGGGGGDSGGGGEA